MGHSSSVRRIFLLSVLSALTVAAVLAAPPARAEDAHSSIEDADAKLSAEITKLKMGILNQTTAPVQTVSAPAAVSSPVSPAPTRVEIPNRVKAPTPTAVSSTTRPISAEPVKPLYFAVSPSQGSTISGVVKIMIDCLPDYTDIAYVQFGDGGPRSSFGNTFTYKLDTTAFPNGEYALKVKAVSKKGALALAQTCTWNIEN
jgi:hypothetical protein